MAGLKLDGTGQVKMATLAEAVTALQTLHSCTERMGVAMKNKSNTATFVAQFKRVGVPLASKLKGQFGMIADQVTAVILAATRAGGGELLRLRAMREGVAQIKVAIEIATTQTIKKHTRTDEHAPAAE